nr:MAG TPA: hypothetical protein [Caudoviricetes sp.]
MFMYYFSRLYVSIGGFFLQPPYCHFSATEKHKYPFYNV